MGIVRVSDDDTHGIVVLSIVVLLYQEVGMCETVCPGIGVVALQLDGL